MAAKVRITGGPLLKARLEAVANSGADIQEEWAHLTAPSSDKTSSVTVRASEGSQ